LAATVQLKRRTGTTGAPSDTLLNDVSSFVEFSTSDSPTPGVAYPIPIPSASVRYSYAVAIFANVSVSPDVSVTSFKLYPINGGSAGWGTGDLIRVGRQTQQTYIQATGTPGVSGTAMQTLYVGIANMDDFYATYNSTSKLAVDDRSGYDHKATGQATGFQIFAEEVASTAVSGENAAVGFYLSWTEV
jgi:hypothetical protein